MSSDPGDGDSADVSWWSSLSSRQKALVTLLLDGVDGAAGGGDCGRGGKTVRISLRALEQRMRELKVEH